MNKVNKAIYLNKLKLNIDNHVNAEIEREE